MSLLSIFRGDPVEDRIADIKKAGTAFADSSALLIEKVITRIESITPTREFFGDRVAEAAAVRRLTLESLNRQLAAARMREKAPTLTIHEASGATTVLPLDTNSPPTLKLGTIQERLGIAVTEAFLMERGFKATHERGARLYHESQFYAICSAVASHAHTVAARHHLRSGS